MKYIFTIALFFSAILNAAQLRDYIDIKKCDQVVDKQLYKICYDYKQKGALGGWVTLYGDKVNAVNIKKRQRLYSEKTIPVKYRSKYKDYTGYGKKWNRGHFVVADADFDYDIKALRKAHTMANIVPHAAKVNQKTWTKVERYGRLLASKLGYINSISIAKYNGSDTIGNGVAMPTALYRIYYNNEAGFELCFHYKNVLNVDYKHDKLKQHLVDCNLLKINR